MTLLRQGDFVTLNFDPATGHEPMKRHPALVVSVDFFDSHPSSLAMVCPVTTLDNGHPLHIAVAKGNTVASFVCIEQLRAVDCKQRQAQVIEGGAIDTNTMTKVLDAIASVFGV